MRWALMLLTLGLWTMQAYPQFAQQGRNGQYSQQDAEECWSQLMSTLQDRLKVRLVHGGGGGGCCVHFAACCKVGQAVIWPATRLRSGSRSRIPVAHLTRLHN